MKMGVDTMAGVCDIREMTAVTGDVEKLLIRRFGGCAKCVNIVTTSAGFVTEDPRYVASWNRVVAYAKFVDIAKTAAVVSFGVASM